MDFDAITELLDQCVNYFMLFFAVFGLLSYKFLKKQHLENEMLSDWDNSLGDINFGRLDREDHVIDSAIKLMPSLKTFSYNEQIAIIKKLRYKLEKYWKKTQCSPQPSDTWKSDLRDNFKRLDNIFCEKIGIKFFDEDVKHKTTFEKIIKTPLQKIYNKIRDVTVKVLFNDTFKVCFIICLCIVVFFLGFTRIQHTESSQSNIKESTPAIAAVKAQSEVVDGNASKQTERLSEQNIEKIFDITNPDDCVEMYSPINVGNIEDDEILCFLQ